MHGYIHTNRCVNGWIMNSSIPIYGNSTCIRMGYVIYTMHIQTCSEAHCLTEGEGWCIFVGAYSYAGYDLDLHTSRKPKVYSPIDRRQIGERADSE